MIKWHPQHLLSLHFCSLLQWQRLCNQIMSFWSNSRPQRCKMKNTLSFDPTSKHCFNKDFKRFYSHISVFTDVSVTWVYFEQILYALIPKNLAIGLLVCYQITEFLCCGSVLIFFWTFKWNLYFPRRHDVTCW